MAKIKFSAVVSDARGIVGGNIFSRNKGGSYVKTFKSPLNPNSNAQKVVRSALSYLSSNWRSLSEAQRNSWIAAAQDWPYQNSLGETYYLSGQQLYIAINQNMRLLGQDYLTAAPTRSDVTNTGLTTLTATTAALTLTFAEATMPTGQAVLVYATKPVSAGVKSFGRSTLRFIGVFDAITTNAIDIKSAYEAIFGAVSSLEGMRIGVGVQDAIEATGQTLTRKPSFSMSSIVVAA